MDRIVLPRIGTAAAWREAARFALARGVPPSALLWSVGAPEPDLFANDALPRVQRPTTGITVPKTYLDMAETVLWHRAPDRFARLYALLWRLRSEPRLLVDRADPDVARLRAMEKEVRRCQHKMKAFVRFREIGDPNAARRQFAAWFEPTHHTVEPTAGFFQRRFSDMDWRIVTPDVSVACSGGRLSFMTDLPRPDLPEDAQEVLWTTYFRNIFNPARLKPQAMRSEMPVKYWRNLPEAAAIPDLIRTAPARARAMADAMPTVPPAFASRVQARKDAMPDLFQTSRDLPLADELSTCTRCPLYANATQAVPGEGPRESALMIVGEQPGDAEDLAGRPFVGPAGQLFDRIAEGAGLERKEVYVTNAVKHFKYRVRGKRRLHERPNRGEVEQCKWWLTREIETVAPRLIVGMGATAAHALTGKAEGILKRRGQIEHGLHGGPVLLTVHPSYLLRLPDESLRGEAEAAFRDDLIRAVALVQRGGDLLAAE